MTPKGKTMSETIKVVRSYFDAQLEEKEVEASGEFTAETDLQAAMAKAGENALAVLNAGLREIFRESVVKEAESKIPADALMDDALKAVERPLVEQQKASGKSLTDARKAVREQIKGSDELKSMIRIMDKALRVK